MQQFVQVDVSMEGAPAQKVVCVITAGKETIAIQVNEVTSYASYLVITVFCLQ